MTKPNGWSQSEWKRRLDAVRDGQMIAYYTEEDANAVRAALSPLPVVIYPATARNDHWRVERARDERTGEMVS